MSKQQHSASLQIVEENQDLIEISQNSFQIEIQQTNQFLHNQKIDDTFQLSLDENSLSFQIEEMKEQLNYQQAYKDNNSMPQIKVLNNQFQNEQHQNKKALPIVQQQRKRKRREIFQKYKQKTTQNPQKSLQHQTVSNDLMNTFDEIFRIKSPQKSHYNQSTLKRQISEPQNFNMALFKRKQQGVGLGQVSLDYVPITFTSENKINQNIQNNKNKVENKNSVSQFRIPSDLTEPKIVSAESNMMIGSTNSFIIDSQAHKISMIYHNQGEVSKDYVELETILQSEIFNQDILDYTIKRTDDSYKNIQISTINPSIIITDQNESNFNRDFSMKKKSQPVQQVIVSNTENKVDYKEEIQYKQEIKQKEGKVQQEKIGQIHEKKIIQNYKIVKQKVINYAQNRIPSYLREIRKRNTVFPNFNLKTNNQQFYQYQNIAFQELLAQFKQALTFLLKINEVAYERFNVMTSLQKILLNQLTLQNFLSSGWQIIYTFQNLDFLKPHQNFLKRKYDYEKVKGALNNYLYIVSYYQKCTLNLGDGKAQKKYLEIREKLWQIEKNIKMIGEDIYLLTIIRFFPQHFYEYLDLLKNPFPKVKSQNQLRYFTKLLAKLQNLKKSGDVLSMSQIGRCVKAKLQKMIQKVLIV